MPEVKNQNSEATDESIGRCEGPCGLVDHHLVEGLCERCREKVSRQNIMPRKTVDAIHADVEELSIRELLQLARRLALQPSLFTENDETQARILLEELANRCMLLEATRP